MKTETKRKFICVEPVSNLAKMRFDNEMDSLHSCYVDTEENGMMFLTSVNGKYKFTMIKSQDSNWKIVK
jgi:hypothetical protein